MTDPTDHSVSIATAAHELHAPRPSDAPVDATVDLPGRRRWPLWLRGLLAVVLLGYAAAWVLGEPSMSQGPVLLRITDQHGVDMRDLFATPLVVASAALIVPRRSSGRR